jgi:hypothetical protein
MLWLQYRCAPENLKLECGILAFDGKPYCVSKFLFLFILSFLLLFHQKHFTTCFGFTNFEIGNVNAT